MGLHPISIWEEMNTIMRSVFVPEDYELELQEVFWMENMREYTDDMFLFVEARNNMNN